MRPSGPDGPQVRRAPKEGIEMKYTQSGGRSAVGPEAWFTGSVHIDGVRNPDEQSAVGCAHVRFSPGARTAWHTHPKGQTLYVTDGIGYVAAADRFMTHIAIQEADAQGQVVTWGEHVTDRDDGQPAATSN